MLERDFWIKTSLLAMAVFSGVLSASALATPESSTKELHALFDEAWGRELRDDPVRASDLGDHRYDALWPDLSIVAMAHVPGTTTSIFIDRRSGRDTKLKCSPRTRPCRVIICRSRWARS